MGEVELNQAIQLIEELKDDDFHGPKPESLIRLAEETLGLSFPPTYRTFLSRYGCGGVEGFEVYGLVSDDFVHSGIPDAIWLTLDERETGGAPPSLIFVAHTGDGGYYAIDVSLKTPNGESPVVEWWPGFGDAVGNGRIVASDFGAFFLEQVRQALES
jgi:hypothetical protein